MKLILPGKPFIAITRCIVAIAVAALFLSACAAGSTAIQAPGGSGLPGGVSIPGGGSSGGGSSDGGGMPSGGSSGGGASGGSSGDPMGGGTEGGGSEGGGSEDAGSSGGQAGLPSGGMGLPSGGMGDSGGGADGEECEDGGITGGGFGGGAGCDESGEIGQFPGGGQSAEELGEELDKSVGDFDEALGEEQRKVASVGRNTEGFGDGSSGAGGSIGLGEQEAGGSSGGSSGGAGAGGAGGAGESQAGPLDGMSDQEIENRTPDDIVVNSFDDIVARQLREAALSEDDPVLRERLWEEYRKYTGLK